MELKSDTRTVGVMDSIGPTDNCVRTERELTEGNAAKDVGGDSKHILSLDALTEVSDGALSSLPKEHTNFVKNGSDRDTENTTISNVKVEKPPMDVVVLSEEELEITNIVQGGPRVIGSPILLEDSAESDNESDKKSDTAEGKASLADHTMSDDKTSQQDQTCSICLGEFDNKAFLDQCFHAFCFYCILQWSEVVRTCPLCKASFSSIIHSVKSLVEFEQHHLPEQSQPDPVPAANQDGRRFRYRTTLADGRPREVTRPRRAGEDAWDQRNHRRQLYLSRRRNKSALAKEKRRSIYANGLWVQQVKQRGKPKFRDITPRFFHANPACIHRLVPWLSRELQVLLDDNQDNVDFIMQLLLTLITRVEIDSDEFAEQLQPFLAGRAHHFAHEFANFARAPYDMTGYDTNAQYNWPQVTQDTRTPAVFDSSVSGWDTPDVITNSSALPSLPGPSGLTGLAGPSGLASSVGLTSSWDDDIPSYSANRSWSPVEGQGSPPRIEVRDDSTPPSVIRIQDSSHSEPSPPSANCGTDPRTPELLVAGATNEDTTERLPKRKHKKKRKHKHKHLHKHTHRHKYESLAHSSSHESLSRKHHARERSRSRSISRSRSREKLRTYRERGRSRSRTSSWERALSSRSKSREESRALTHRGKARSRPRTLSRERSQSRSASREQSRPGTHHVERSRPERSRRHAKRSSRSRSISRQKSRSPSTADALSRTQPKRRSFRSNSHLFDLPGPSRTASSRSPTEVEDGFPVVVRPHSPTEDEMRREIEALETRIAADTKRLLELQRKQEERSEGTGTTGLCELTREAIETES